MKAKPLEPPVVLFICLVAIPLLHLLSPLGYWLHFPGNLTGILLLATGIGLNLAADARFTRAATTVKPQGKPSVLIVSGPFRFSRHPMYLGMTLALSGLSLLCGSVSCLFPAAAFFLIMEFRFVRREEKTMVSAFSGQWQAYRNRVHRWIQIIPAALPKPESEA